MYSHKPLTVEEVADYLQIGRTTVYRMAERRWGTKITRPRSVA
jgi:predicted DNA-binding transcriptional regulator AlpA